MSIPEIVFGFAIPLAILLLIAWPAQRFLPAVVSRFVLIVTAAISLAASQIGLLLIARKWSRLENAQDWSDLFESGIDKFVTPTIAADWLPIGILGWAIICWIGSLLIDRKLPESEATVATKSPSGTKWLRAIFVILQAAAVAGLVYGMLSGSKYISREPDLWKKVMYVGLPTILLASGWLARICCAPSTANTPEKQSRLGWLSALAILLSATLLILTSGSASIAIQANTAIIILLAWLLGVRLGNPTSFSVFWLHGIVGLIVVLSGFFAETTPYAMAAWFVSSVLLIRYWPSTELPMGKRWLLSLGIALPALAVAFYSAAIFAINMSGSTSEY